MNTNGLTKLYDRLTARERLALIQAAEARADVTERQRLERTAPTQFRRLPDYLHLSLAVNLLALIYVTEQLEHAAGYWHALWRLDDPRETKPEDWLLAADVAAYLFACNAQAWQRLCEELNLDHASLTRGNHQGWMLEYCQAHLPDAALPLEEIAARLRERGVEDPTPVTADDLLAGWRETFHWLAGRHR